jgi:hypothetical protein
VFVEQPAVAHIGRRLDLGPARLEPLVGPHAEGLLAETRIEVEAAGDVGLNAVCERLGLALGPKRLLGTIAPLGVPVADLPGIAPGSGALAFDLADVPPCSPLLETARVFCGFLS